MINPNHNILCYTGIFVMIEFLQQDTLYNSCLLNYTQYKCRNMLNMSLNWYNILNRKLMYKLIVQMCNIDKFLLQDNQYNYLRQTLNKSNIMHYMLNKYIHQCNILMNKLKYRLIGLGYNMDKFQLNYMLNKSYLIQNK